jgi:hypothetical protein
MSNTKYYTWDYKRDNEISKEIKARTESGNRCYFAFQKLMRSSNASQKLKVVIYKTIIRPVVLYGAETWDVNQKR